MVVAPGVLADNLICDDMQVTKANAIDTVVQQNEFVDNSVHFIVWGGANNTLYDRNKTTGGGGVLALAATMTLGRVNLCDVASDRIFIGKTLNTKFTNSHFSHVGRTPLGQNHRNVEMVNSMNDLVKGNHFEGDGTPIELFGSINSRVEDNVIEEPFVNGITLTNSQNAVVTRNIILDSNGDGVHVQSLPLDDLFANAFDWTENRNSNITCNHIEGVTKANRAAVRTISLTASNDETGAHIAHNRMTGNTGFDVLFAAPENMAILRPLPQDTVDDQTENNMVVRVDSKKPECAPTPN